MDNLEVHVGVISFYKGKVLALKRSENKRLYPGLWECGGGKINPGETFEEAAIREMREEIGAVIEIKGVLKTYHIDTSDGSIPGLKFVAEIKEFLDGNEPNISDEHTEYRYIDKDDIDTLGFIPGVEVDVREGFERMKLL